MRTPGDFLTKLPIRTMDGIQEHIIEWGKRNAISRRYHAKDAKEAVATWKLDLDRILRVFNVCSVAPAWQLLTFRFQVELRANLHVTGSEINQDATNKPSTENDPAATHTIVSDIHRNKLKGPEGADGRNQAVSTTLLATGEPVLTSA